MARVEINQAEMDRLLQDPAIGEFADRLADKGARDAASDAPRMSGRGAASIKGRAEFENGRWRIKLGPDRPHGYMRFPERGTRYLRAQRFMERAARRLTNG